MKINKTLILLLLLVFCISLGAVSATDNDNINIDDVSIQDNDISVIEINTVSNTNNEREISELSADSGDFAELQSVINQASSGSTIYLTKDYTFVSGDGNGVSISKPLTIDGQGHTINGSGTARAFHVTNDKVVIININFVNTYRNGDKQRGSAICIDHNGTIMNCHFTNSSCDWEGGAIYFGYGGSIINCSFENCHASDDGGAIAIFSNFGTVSGCDFTNCHIDAQKDDYDGGAIYLDCGGVVSDCNFLNCYNDEKDASEGGVICINHGAGTVTNCNFNNSYCKKYAGAIYFQKDGNVINCSFTNSSACNDGGTITITGKGNVIGCNFTNCYTTYNRGGAVYLNCEGSVTGCNFNNCSNTGGYGGTLYLNDGGNVTGCNFTDSFCNSMGGAIYIKGGTISNCIFTNCSSNTEGGAITIWGKSGTVSDCAFINCYIDRNWYSDPSDGGAVYFSAGGTVSNCNFTNCYCLNRLFLNEGNDGGAISINGAKGTVSNCNFMNCHADSYGGAVYFSDEGTVSNCNFTNCDAYGNTTYHHGGAICIKGDKGTVNDCVFFNSSASYGGAIFIRGDKGTVNNCSFVDCASTGGVIYSSTANVNNCTFTNCSGSGIYCGGLNDDTIISDCVFTDCYCDSGSWAASSDGGAIHLNGGQISDCNFTNCHVDPYDYNSVWYGSGGAIYIYSHGGSVSNCNFLNCFAYKEGGAICINSDGTVNNCSFINCYANAYKIDIPYHYDTQSFGGAITILGDATISDSIFTDCYSSYDSGAIYAYIGKISNCNFTNCFATACGAIMIAEGDVKYCNFTNCYAKGTNSSMAGALFIAEGDVEYCNFTNCYAQGTNSMGGAICRVADYTDGDITNCNFVNCYTTATNTSLGGAIFNSAMATSGITGDNSDCSIKLSNFTNCYAQGNHESEGGALYIVSHDGEDTWHMGIPFASSVIGFLLPGFYGLIGEIFNLMFWAVPGGDGHTDCISCNFINCNASSKGGAISLEGENYVGDCNFINNYAPKGSSIFIWDDAELEIASSYAYDVPSNVASIFIDDVGELDSNIIITTIDNKTRPVDNGQVVNLNATITTDTGMSIAGGLLTFTVNGKSLDAKSGVDGLYSTNRAGKNYTVDFIGTKPVNAEFDDDYWEGDATVIMGNLTTNRLDVNLVADSVKGSPGEKLNVTIKVTDINKDPVTGGVITVKFEGSDYLANVTDGVATVELYLAEFGDHSASAFYNGSTTSAYNDASLNFTVYAKDFASITANANNVSYGENVTVNGTVTGIEGKSTPTGNVTIYVDGVEKNTINLDVNDKFSYSIPNLSGGNHNISLRYNGDENYSFDECSVNVTVIPINSTVSVNAENITYGENSTIYVNVTTLDGKVPTGQVLIRVSGHEGTVDLVDGKANLTVSGLNAGTRRVSVIYLGNENYTKSVAFDVINVSKASSSISATIEDVNFGENVTVNVTVTGVDVPSGNVTILVNGTEFDTVNITNGTVIYAIANLTGGDYNISVCYNGDCNYDASEFSDIVIVKAINPTVSVSVEDITYGDDAVVNVNVTGLNDTIPTGNVTILVNGTEFGTVNITSGTVIYSISNLSAGDYNISVCYNGDSNYNSISSEKLFTVNKADPQVIVDIGSDESFGIKIGDTVVAIVGVPDDATGTVSFSLDNETWISITIPEDDNLVEYDIPNLDIEDYILFVKYSGDKNYNPVYSENPFSVDQLNTVVTVDPVKGKAGEKVNITVRVTDERGNPVPEGTVIIGFNCKEYKVNVVNGIATIEVTLPNKAGTYFATAYYEGFNYNSSYTTFTVEVSNLPGPNPNPNPVNLGNMENTGNPLFVLLVALCAIGLESFRRKF